MKFYLILLTLILNLTKGKSQKKTIDFESYKEWQEIAQQSLSNNGKYLFYQIKKEDLIIKSIIVNTTGEISFDLKEIIDGKFTADSKYFIYQKNSDTISIQELSFPYKYRELAASSFNLPANSISDIASFSNGDVNNEKLILLFLKNQIQFDFDHVYSFKINEKGTLTALGDNNGKVYLVDTQSQKYKIISNCAYGVSNFAFSDNAVWFIASQTSEVPLDKRAIYKYQIGNDSASIYADSKTIKREIDYSLEGSIEIVSTDHGDAVCFKLFLPNENTNLKASQKKNLNVTIWSQKDPTLKSKQISKKKAFWAMLDSSEKVTLLEDPSDSIIIFNNFEFPQKLPSVSPFALSLSIKKYIAERDWGIWKTDLYKVSLLNGSRKIIKQSVKGFVPSISPQGNYVVWFDEETRKYMAYNNNSESLIHLNTPITAELKDTIGINALEYPYGVAGWLDNEKYVLIYDRHDIWKVDLKGKQPADNLTEGLGHKKNTIFRFYKHRHNIGRISSAENFSSTDKILLRAFNTDSRFSGFYILNLNKTKGLRELCMGPYEYSEIIKASGAEIYAVTRGNVVTPNNIFLTTDFKQFIQLSSLNEQQKKFNWLTCERLTLKDPNGKATHCLLYKPEDFDDQKKYPLVFYPYEQDAYGLYEYLSATTSNGTINIPTFVSNGYIVCVPDIYFELGKPGESGLRYIENALNNLSKLPYIDTTKVGIQGFSFGGYITNYVVTHSNRFAAACSGGGISNLMSLYGYQDKHRNVNNQYWTLEKGQQRLGKPLWEKPSLYIENSPICYADSMHTPLLIMFGDNDFQVTFNQSIEWFTALRRLKKPVWMLQYKNEGHGLKDPINKLDFSTRLMQFFDHYLKGKPAACWMSN